MKLPIVFHVDGQTEANSDRHYVLKLKKSLSGLKQAIFQILKADDQIPILTMQKMLCQELEWWLCTQTVKYFGEVHSDQK